MSLYTVGEIVAWLLVAAALGFVLGWLLRGILRPPRSVESVPERPASTPSGTRVLDVECAGVAQGGLRNRAVGW